MRERVSREEIAALSSLALFCAVPVAVAFLLYAPRYSVTLALPLSPVDWTARSACTHARALSRSLTRCCRCRPAIAFLFVWRRSRCVALLHPLLLLFLLLLFQFLLLLLFLLCCVVRSLELALARELRNIYKPNAAESGSESPEIERAIPPVRNLLLIMSLSSLSLSFLLLFTFIAHHS